MQSVYLDGAVHAAGSRGTKACTVPASKKSALHFVALFLYRGPHKFALKRVNRYTDKRLSIYREPYPNG